MRSRLCAVGVVWLALGASGGCGPAVVSSPDGGKAPVETGEGEGEGEGETGQGSTPLLIVNELMADNQQTVLDDYSASSDWIELYNPGTEAVDLDAWTITDSLDEPGKHSFYTLVIEPGAWQVLWADGHPELGVTHLGFQLDEDGEAVGLFDASGAAVDGLRFGEQSSDISLARQPDGDGAWGLDTTPSPGESNGGGS